MKKKLKISDIFINLFFILLSCTFIVPFLLIIGISFSKEIDIYNFGYSFIPRNFSVISYIFVNFQKVINAYKVSAIVSFGGTFFSLLASAAFAYVISRKDFKYTKLFSLFAVFTMLFSGGLVPYYILMTKYLHLQDTYYVLILALFGNVFYILVLKSFFREVPEALRESAFIDGAREIRIFAQIMLPLTKAGLATVGLFTLYGYWNDWYNAMLFINKAELVPLQYLLQMLLRMVQVISRNAAVVSMTIIKEDTLPTETLRMAMVVIATGPMFIVFIALQKYFVRGITLGAVKG